MKRKGLGRWIASALVMVLIVSNISVSGIATKTVYAKDAETVPAISNNDFEDGSTFGWNLVGNAFSIDKNKNGNEGSYLNVWTSSAENLSLSQIMTDAPAGTYTLSFKMVGDSGLETFRVSLNNSALLVTSDGVNYTDHATIISDSDAWKTWTTYTTKPIYIGEKGDLSLSLKAQNFQGWCAFDDFSVSYETGDHTGDKTEGDDGAIDSANEQIIKAKNDLNTLIQSIPDNYEEMHLIGIAVLRTTLMDAQEIYNNPDATLGQVRSCIEELTTAIESLYFEDDDVFVDKIPALSENQIRGMDISSYLSIMESFDEMNMTREEDNKIGFRNEDGQLLDRQEFFHLLAENGVNTIRLRVWNDPYDQNGNGYGGGNNDLSKAVEMGQYATNAGMAVLIDFHFSDFWADPEKQQAPKAWKELNVSQKADAISEYTTESLNTLLEAGVDVTMVQIGNETNGKFCSETEWDNMNVLFDAGCDAVHAVAEEYNRTILAVLHFTNPEKAGKQMGYADSLAAYHENEGVSYDVFATSYYPFWHGSLSNLNTVLSSIAKKYDKYVMVAETSYASSLDDIDGHENTVKSGNNDTGEDLKWPFTQQGQINEFRDVLNAIVSSDVTLTNGDKAGLGVFWWEGAWIGLQDVYESDHTVSQDKLEENKSYWESHGSGWASSYAGSYDPKDAGKWYGGSAVDNQSFFTKDGRVTNAIKVFRYDYLKYGARTENIKAEQVEKATVSLKVKDVVTEKLPDKVTVLFNDGSKHEETVSWNHTEIEVLQQVVSKYSGVGNYMISGTTNTTHLKAICAVSVEPVHLLQAYSFEQDIQAWTISENSGASITSDDPKSGQKSLHFWNAEEVDFVASQDVEISKSGTYAASIYAQGASGTKVTLSLERSGNTISENTVEMNGWCNWIQPKVDMYITDEELADGTATVRYKVHVVGEAGSWGTLDDAYFYLSSRADEDNAGSGDEDIEDKPNGGEDVEDRPSGGEVEDKPSSGNGSESGDDSNGSGNGIGSGNEIGGENGTEGENGTGEGNAAGPSITVTKKVKTSKAYYIVSTKPDGTQTASFSAPIQTSKKETTITIPAQIKLNGKNIKVTSVAEKAFYGNKKVKKVVLGKYIKTIEKNAFRNCTSLNTVTLNTDLTKLEDSAFSGCKKLTSINMKKNIKSIGNNTFKHCTKLKNIKITSTRITKIGKNAFKGIDKKATIKVPKKYYSTYKKLLSKAGLPKTVKIKK